MKKLILILIIVFVCVFSIDPVKKKEIKIDTFYTNINIKKKTNIKLANINIKKRKEIII